MDLMAISSIQYSCCGTEKTMENARLSQQSP